MAPRITGLRLNHEGDPAVLAMFDYRFDAAVARADYWDSLANQAVLIVLHLSWVARGDRRIEECRQRIAAHQRRYPLHRLVCACGEPARAGGTLSVRGRGAMLASIQYLLSGLPVVTTPSQGGRHMFFDADNSLTVEPTADAVAAGVRDMIARRTDPWAIRARALERIAEHRRRFRELVIAFQAAHGVPEGRRLSPDWELRSGRIFTDRIA